jgi:hypothetical protein
VTGARSASLDASTLTREMLGCSGHDSDEGKWGGDGPARLLAIQRKARNLARTCCEQMDGQGRRSRISGSLVVPRFFPRV